MIYRIIFVGVALLQIVLHGTENIVRKKFSERYPARWYKKKSDIHTRHHIKCFIESIDDITSRFEGYRKNLKPLDPEQPSTYSLFDVYRYFHTREVHNHTHMQNNYQKYLKEVRPDESDTIRALHAAWITYQSYCDIKRFACIAYINYWNSLKNYLFDPMNTDL